MKEIYIIETSTQPGFWEVTDKKGYMDKKVAIDIALNIMEASNKRIAARVTTIEIVK